jgi:hypothetical protein
MISVDLPTGDKLEFSFTGDMFGLPDTEKDLIFGLVKTLRDYKASIAPKVPPVGAPRSKAAEKSAAKDAGPELAS